MTKAEPKSVANPIYKNPRPRIPVTDPKQIQNLWNQVRKRNLGSMPAAPRPNFMADTKASARKGKKVANEHLSATPSTILSTKSQALTVKNPEFRGKCLTPRGIIIDDTPQFSADPCLHFHTERPQSYRELPGLEKSSLWLNTQSAFLKEVNKEYLFMNYHNLCEAEYSSFAKENFLKREPRDNILDNTEDPSRRFRRAERMLEFTCKPDEESHWIAPPILDNQDHPTYTFDIRPDCTYWLSLHAFNSSYVGLVGKFVHVAQTRITCPYFTVEFKRDDTNIKKAEDQVATFGALALYNRYQLRHRRTTVEGTHEQQWTHEQECQLRHYTLTITRSIYSFWCLRPRLEGGKWNGCKMVEIFSGHLEQLQGAKDFVSWINEIHRWGLTNYIKSCETDIKIIAKKHTFRTSELLSEKECTCGNSSDAASTSE